LAHVNQETKTSLIEALRNPHLYGRSGGPIPLLETHISWVLLAGEFAYKIKKPVDLGFVDFTTLARRHFFCLEELRLNRRLAPELYLDVVPVTGSPADPHWGGAGPALEYAVRMREFPQSELLPALLARGELTPMHLDRLARRVADFHAEIEIAAPESPWGTPERVLDPVRENFRQLNLSPHAPEVQARIQQLEQWSLDQHRRRFADFAARKQGGCIRECHGDMHLGNMVRRDGEVMVFDCIEFNERLRWIDVISEVAFLAMDLTDRGRPDFAHRFMNAYLELSGDYGGLSVFPFYAVYRALVRAKVTCIRRKQGGPTEADLQRLQREFEGYLHLAAQYTLPRQPALLITHGVSGSGKTSQTQALIEAGGFVRIRSDVERKRLFGLAAESRSESPLEAGLYGPEANRRTYAQLGNLAETIVRAGHPVIVDATFLQQVQRTSLRSLSERLGVPFAILDFAADEVVLRARIAERERAGGDASEATLAVLERQLQSREPLTDAEQALSWRIDPGHPLDVPALLASLALRSA
jgi:hypothetical protein